MANANIEFFYDNGARIGSAADYLRSAAELLEIESAVGDTNILSNAENEMTIADLVALRKDRTVEIVNYLALKGEA